MTLVAETIRQLQDSRNHLAILELQAIQTEYGNVFQFLTEFRAQPSGADFRTRFAPPDENPNGEGYEVVLTADPTDIREHENSNSMVFIVKDISLIKNALRRYVVT